MRVATVLKFKTDPASVFQSTPPMRVATIQCRIVRSAYSNFNPRHPCGWRPKVFTFLAFSTLFQSTPPMRVATCDGIVMCGKWQISIHATHAGGDYVLVASALVTVNISIHATHAGGDKTWQVRHCSLHLFQSTPPMRVATFLPHRCHHLPTNFNPRHPCGWRHLIANTITIIIHISIHATHAGGDCNGYAFLTISGNFNPRHPCGWRQKIKVCRSIPLKFQSTPPMRVATGMGATPVLGGLISIHATHAGGDVAPVVLP